MNEITTTLTFCPLKFTVQSIFTQKSLVLHNFKELNMGTTQLPPLYIYKNLKGRIKTGFSESVEYNMQYFLQKAIKTN